MDLVGTAPPWPIGLATAVLAGVLLWVVSGRLRLRPETRAASTALFAGGALLAEATTDGVDGRATLLLAVAAAFASAGRPRSALAALACGAAVVAAPVLGVGLLVLLGVMALTRDLAARLRPTVRRTVGGALVVAGGVLAGLLGRAGAAPTTSSFGAEPATVTLPVVTTLVVATVLVGGVLWGLLPWIRPPVAAAVALAACLCLPGAGPAAVLPVTAALGVLTAVLVEERHRLAARPAIVGATMAGLVACAGLLPAVSDLAPAPVPVSEVRPAAARAVPEAPRVRPVSMQIPALDVAGPLGELTQADSGELLAPDDPGLAGWYSGGVVPGDVGPAVIGGHVDSRRGPGVFFALRSLRPGDVVAVTRSDGRTVRFAVTAVREVPKAQFPTEAVYAPTPRPELRLITCGGVFDRSVRSYTDNVVVEAVVTERETPSPVQRN